MPVSGRDGQTRLGERYAELPLQYLPSANSQDSVFPKVASDVSEAFGQGPGHSFHFKPKEWDAMS